MSDLVRARERVKYARAVVQVTRDEAASSAAWHAWDAAEAQQALAEALVELKRLGGDAGWVRIL